MLNGRQVCKEKLKFEFLGFYFKCNCSYFFHPLRRVFKKLVGVISRLKIGKVKLVQMSFDSKHQLVQIFSLPSCGLLAQDLYLFYLIPNYSCCGVKFVTSSHANAYFLQVCFLEQNTRFLYKPFKEPLRDNLPQWWLPQVSVKHWLVMHIQRILQ